MRLIIELCYHLLVSHLQERLRERIIVARESIGASQADLGQQLGIDNTAVSKIEQGKRAVSSIELARIAEFCGKPVSWFFDESPGIVAQFRGASDADASRRDLRWLAEFADAHEFLIEELR